MPHALRMFALFLVLSLGILIAAAIGAGGYAIWLAGHMSCLK